MNLKTIILVIAAAIIGIALGWAAHRETAPLVPAADDRSAGSEMDRVASAEPVDDFPLHGEEEEELEDLFVEGEAIPAPEEARRGRVFRPLAETWAELAPRAEQGDARAAMQLFMALDMCRRVLQPNEREQRMRERMEIDTRQVSAEWQQRIRERMETIEQNCAGADPAWLDTGLDWLTQAADGGEIGAKLMWATRAGAYLDLANADESTRQWHAQMSQRYLGEAVGSGSTQAMLLVARRDSTQDPVNALAHAALAYRVTDERMRAAALRRLDTGGNPRRQRFAQNQQIRLQSMVDTASDRLDNAGIAAAHRRADELYERCCR